MIVKIFVSQTIVRNWQIKTNWSLQRPPASVCFILNPPAWELFFLFFIEIFVLADNKGGAVNEIFDQIVTN